MELKTIAGLVGKPCPICGASLLTQADARSLSMIILAANIVNLAMFPFQMLNWILFLLHLKTLPEHAIVSSNMDGSGHFHFEIKD